MFDGSNKDKSSICNSISFISQLISTTIASASSPLAFVNFHSFALITRFFKAFCNVLYLSYNFFISHIFPNIIIF
ncbi:MAG: hypothetical protein WCG25_06630 [bacterium]